MNMTQNELKLILDSQEGTREQLKALAVDMKDGFQRVHTRIDQVAIKPSSICLAALATKAELAYVDGRISANQSGINRVWRAAQITALATLVVSAAFILEHQGRAFEAFHQVWKSLAGVF